MAAARRLGILADDLIWSVRLAEQTRQAGAEPLPLRALDQLDAALSAPGVLAGLVVDLTARTYDAVEACRRAAAARIPVLAIGQHDDHERNRAARSAGAQRVVAYRLMAKDGPAILSLFLATDHTPTMRYADDGVPRGEEAR